MTFHDEKVAGVKAKRVQVDEIWSFTYAKQKNVRDGQGSTGTARVTPGPGPASTPTAS